MLIVKLMFLVALDLAAWIYVVREFRGWRLTRKVDPSFARGFVVAVGGVIAIVVTLVRG